MLALLYNVLYKSREPKANGEGDRDFSVRCSEMRFRGPITDTAKLGRLERQKDGGRVKGLEAGVQRTEEAGQPST